MGVTAAVVVNPTKVAAGDLRRTQVEECVARAGWNPARWLETTQEDPGQGGRTLDVGRLGSDRTAAAAERFAVMAGMGLDAATMRDAPEALKARIGWLAYLVAAARHLRGPGFTVAVRIDDAPAVRARVRTVLVANVGRLQAGLVLIPDAAPDDGLLDVALIGPRGALDWLRLATRLARQGDIQDHRYRTFRGRRITITTRRARPREADGDLIGSGTRLVAEVEAGALIVRVPR